MGELTFWTRLLAHCARVDTAVVAGWLRATASIGIGTALLAMLALVATGVRIPSSITATIIGSAATVALLALPWLLTGSRPDFGDVRGRQDSRGRHSGDGPGVG